MMKKKNDSNYHTIRISGSSLNAVKSDFFKELAKQNIYFGDSGDIISIYLEEISKSKKSYKTLASIAEYKVVSNDFVGKKIVFPLRKSKAIKNAKFLDFKIIYDLSPIPTGTERGITKLSIAKNDSGLTVLLIGDRQFAFKK